VALTALAVRSSPKRPALARQTTRRLVPPLPGPPPRGSPGSRRPGPRARPQPLVEPRRVEPGRPRLRVDAGRVEPGPVEPGRAWRLRVDAGQLAPRRVEPGRAWRSRVGSDPVRAVRARRPAVGRWHWNGAAAAGRTCAREAGNRVEPWVASVARGLDARVGGVGVRGQVPGRPARAVRGASRGRRVRTRSVRAPGAASASAAFGHQARRDPPRFAWWFRAELPAGRRNLPMHDEPGAGRSHP
jgi:hypothetical protein